MNGAISIIKGLVALLKEARFDGVTSVGATNIAGIIKAAERFITDYTDPITLAPIDEETEDEVTV